MEPDYDLPPHPSVKEILWVLLGTILLLVLFTLAIPKDLGKVQLILGESVIVLPALFLVRAKGYRFRSVFRLNPVSGRVVLLSLCLGVSVTVLGDEIDRIVGIFIKLPPEVEQLIQELLGANSFTEWLIVVFAAVFLAGLVEEMVFRGLLLQAFERRFELTYAIFLSALLFAMFHFHFWIIQVLLLGVLLGFLSWRSDSIIPGMILHWVNNAFALAFRHVKSEDLGWYNWHDHVYPPVVVVAACVTFYALKAFWRVSKKDA
ncbi:MAG: CPBP family intramembrane metalloprotease [Calditrichaeota bacterium]|nr:MAG: CPBP family intramembrane metalloprotease [Calditrichota bacterium]